jgi:transposase
MPHYVGLDVSQKTTAISIVDEQGRRLWRGLSATDPGAISARVLRHAGIDGKVGIETGSMTPWLVHGLRSAGLDDDAAFQHDTRCAEDLRLAARRRSGAQM